MYISATNPQMVNFACIGTFCSVDFGLGDRLFLTKFDKKDKRFQFFVVIILLQANLFCGGTKAVLYPHCTRYVYVPASITNKIVLCGCHGMRMCRYNNYYKIFYR